MRRFAAFAALALTLVPAAHAATRAPVFGLRAVGANQRGYFVYSLTPRATRSGVVIVSNVGTAPGTVRLFTADATTGKTTGTVYETDRQPTRAGAWVKLSATSLRLRPGQSRRVRFTVHVPRGTPAGEWVGAIVAETSHRVAGTSNKQKANVQIKIRDLTIVAVEANVPGPRVITFKIGAVSAGGEHGYQQLFVHLENAGNALVKPTGTVTVFDATNTLIEKLPFRMDTFVPKTGIDYPILLKKALGPGDYTAAVTLLAGRPGLRSRAFTSSTPFSVTKQNVKQVFTPTTPVTAPPAATSSGGSSVPWSLIGAGAAAVLALVAAGLWWTRRRRRPSWQEPDEPAEPPILEPVRLVTPAQRIAAVTGPPAPVAPPVEPAPVKPALVEERAPAPAPVPLTPRPAEEEHLWEVAYDRGHLGSDGVWRFPHRCRTCGLELLATDVRDASARAAEQQTA